MIIAIPVDDNKKDVCVSFGRAPYFMIHNTESGITNVVDNNAASLPGGAGIQAAQLIVDHNANVVVTVRCGENSAEVFKAADISVYKADSIDAQENIEAISNGMLVKMRTFHPGFQGKQ